VLTFNLGTDEMPGKKADVRDEPGFYELLGSCIEQVLSNAEIWQKLRNTYPNAPPFTQAHVSGWCNESSTWRKFDELFKPKKGHLQLLWDRAGLRGADRKARTVTLEEKIRPLAGPTKQKPLAGARFRTFG
jgi:hypothetical protein